MKIIQPSIKLIWKTENPLQAIELAGRTCYKSEDNITYDSAIRFVRKLIERGHEAMIEHASVSYRVTCDRGVSHEIVRHRLFSYAQESTRYVNYQKKGMEFIEPCFWEAQMKNAAEYETWKQHMEKSEEIYNHLIKLGCHPQEARSVLPNSLKTEIVITGNLRQWRHFLKLRTAKFAHPQMQQVANMLLKDINNEIPIVFEDIQVE